MPAQDGYRAFATRARAKDLREWRCFAEGILMVEILRHLEAWVPLGS